MNQSLNQRMDQWVDQGIDLNFNQHMNHYLNQNLANDQINRQIKAWMEAEGDFLPLPVSEADEPTDWLTDRLDVEPNIWANAIELIAALNVTPIMIIIIIVNIR